MATKYDAEYQRRWRLKNKAHIKQYLKIWRFVNKEDRKKLRSSPRERLKANKLERARYLKNIQFKLRKKYRATVTRGLKLYGDDPHSKALRYLVGCNAYEYRKYIQSLFQKGMEWGKIHIDHIVPLDKFDLTKFSEVKKCFHYSNCQPLWPHENRKKGNR